MIDARKRNQLLTAVALMLLTSPDSAFSFHQTPVFTPRKSPSRHTKTNLHAFALEGAASAVESFFVSQPYVSAFLTCSFKASAADFVAQTQQPEPQFTSGQQGDHAIPVDVSRNIAFLLYGGLYQGMAQQFMYSTLYPDMFGHELHMQSLAMQVAFDMTVVGPLLCLPIAYAVKSLFTADNEGSNDITKLDAVKSGLDKYVEDVMTRGLLLKYWALWTPVNFLTFSVVPQHFRVAFVAAVSFFWVFILSSVASSSEADDDSSHTTRSSSLSSLSSTHSQST